MSTRHLALILTMTTLGALAPARTVAASPHVADRIAARSEPMTASPASPARDASRYAEREQAAHKQLRYRGGKMIYIGISATAAIVIIVLLVLLL